MDTITQKINEKLISYARPLVFPPLPLDIFSFTATLRWHCGCARCGNGLWLLLS